MKLNLLVALEPVDQLNYLKSQIQADSFLSIDSNLSKLQKIEPQLLHQVSLQKLAVGDCSFKYLWSYVKHHYESGKMISFIIDYLQHHHLILDPLYLNYYLVKQLMQQMVVKVEPKIVIYFLVFEVVNPMIVKVVTIINQFLVYHQIKVNHFVFKYTFKIMVIEDSFNNHFHVKILIQLQLPYFV